MMSKDASRLALVAAGAVRRGGAGARGAGAPAVTCGATLTTSTTLSADLVDCPGTALVVGADGITVNLAGHTISGTNAAGARASPATATRRPHRRRPHHGLPGQRRRDPRRKSVVRGVTVRRIGEGGVEGEPVSAGIAISDSPAAG